MVILKPSDKVRVNLNLAEFKRLQDNNVYGGWHDDMARVSKDVHLQKMTITTMTATLKISKRNERRQDLV